MRTICEGLAGFSSLAQAGQTECLDHVGWAATFDSDGDIPSRPHLIIGPTGGHVIGEEGRETEDYGNEHPDEHFRQHNNTSNEILTPTVKDRAKAGD
jgi:hypothetical protein